MRNLHDRERLGDSSVASCAITFRFAFFPVGGGGRHGVIEFNQLVRVWRASDHSTRAREAVTRYVDHDVDVMSA